MRCQEGGEEDDPPLVPRLGTRTGSTLLFSTTTRFCDMKQKRNYSFLTSRSIAKTSYTIRSSGVLTLLQTGRVFVMTFIVGVKSYMEVSNETSDTRTDIYGTVHEKIAPLIYYKNVIKMHHVCIAITSQRLTLSTSYFHHFILHHFSTVKCILESWTISVPTFLRAIPPGVQNYHIFV